MTETLYVLACLACDPPLPMPFDSERERGKWAAEHTEATGHDSWRLWTDAMTSDETRPRSGGRCPEHALTYCEPCDWTDGEHYTPDATRLNRCVLCGSDRCFQQKCQDETRCPDCGPHAWHLLRAAWRRWTR